MDYVLVKENLVRFTPDGDNRIFHVIKSVSIIRIIILYINLLIRFKRIGASSTRNKFAYVVLIVLILINVCLNY